MQINRPLALRAGAVQLGGIVVLGLATGLALSHQVFEDWGWLIGPGAWMIAALVTARILRLPYGLTILGAALAGVPSAVATVLGLHWLGALIAVVLFALWCGGVGARTMTTRTA